MGGKMNFHPSYSSIRGAFNLALLGTASFLALAQGGAAQAQDHQLQTRPLRQQLTALQRQQIMQAQGGALGQQVAQADEIPD